MTIRLQVVRQVAAVVELARHLADVTERANNEIPIAILHIVGERTARQMEELGDMLNGMDAVGDEADRLAPVFDEAQKMFPVKHRGDMNALLRDFETLQSDYWKLAAENQALTNARLISSAPSESLSSDKQHKLCPLCRGPMPADEKTLQERLVIALSGPLDLGRVLDPTDERLKVFNKLEQRRIIAAMCACEGISTPLLEATCPSEFDVLKMMEGQIRDLKAQLSATTPTLTCPRCGDEWRGQACVGDCPLWKMVA